jgi:hypothetical protein
MVVIGFYAEEKTIKEISISIGYSIFHNPPVFT